MVLCNDDPQGWQRQNYVQYDLDQAAAPRALNAGVATTMATVSLGAFVPPNSRTVKLFATLALQHNAITGFLLGLRRTGATHAGNVVARVDVQAANNSVGAISIFDFVISSGQQIDYMLNAVPSIIGGANLDLAGYFVPNGDA